MVLTRPSWKSRFAFVADIGFLVLIAVGGLIELHHGVKWRGGALSLTASSGLRAFLLAVLVLTLRHAVVPQPSFVARMRTSLRGLAAGGALWVNHLSAAADSALVSLAGLALVIDLAGGWTWPLSSGRAVLPSGAGLALAALAGLLLRSTALRQIPSLAQRLRARSTAAGLRVEPPTPRALTWALLLFGGATAIVLRQQLRAYTDVPDLGDPLFSMWRLAWVAHQLPLDPFHLFDANIFHPAERTLAYSDAMLLPAFVGSPALWLGAPLAVVYTTLLLFSFVAAGVSMFALVRAVTRHDGAAAIAGLVFAFDPFRFSHYSHLELQCTWWMPLAVLFAIRALATGSRRDGVLAGLFVALQALSSLYYGVFLAVSLTVFALCCCLLVKRPARGTLRSLAVALLVVAVATMPLLVPYWINRGTVGERGAGEVRAYSATFRDYVTVDARNAAYRAR